MRLKPLVLSVCESESPGGATRRSCPFCGVRLAEGREPLFHAEGFDEASCAPCSLVRHLERETIAEEAVLIWLPEMTQSALNALANRAHRLLAAEGALYLAASPFSVTSGDHPNPALEAIRAIAMRSVEAEARFGTASPLKGIDAEADGRPDAVLQGCSWTRARLACCSSTTTRPRFA